MMCNQNSFLRSHRSGKRTLTGVLSQRNGVKVAEELRETSIMQNEKFIDRVMPIDKTPALKPPRFAGYSAREGIVLSSFILLSNRRKDDRNNNDGPGYSKL